MKIYSVSSLLFFLASSLSIVSTPVYADDIVEIHECGRGKKLVYRQDGTQFCKTDYTPSPINYGLGGAKPGDGGQGGSPKAAPTYENNSNIDNDCQSGAPQSTNNPVVIATGEKHKTETDFLSQGEYGLGLERTYRSRQATGAKLPRFRR